MKNMLLLSAALLMLSACSSRVQVTEHPTGRESTISTFSSYCWAEDNNEESALEKVAPTGGHHQVFDSAIREVIDNSLAQKHYRKGACAHAEFIVDYRVGLHEDVAVVDATVTDDTDSANPYGPQWRIGDDSSVTYEGIAEPEEEIITVRHGTVHVAAFSSNNRLLWHRSGEKLLNEQTSEAERESSLRQSIAEIMDSFPDKLPR